MLRDVAVDTTTPQGAAMAQVLAVFAELERRLIGQRTSDALAVRKAQGVRLGRPPVLPAEVVSRHRQRPGDRRELVRDRTGPRHRWGSHRARRSPVVPGDGAGRLSGRCRRGGVKGARLVSPSWLPAN